MTAHAAQNSQAVGGGQEYVKDSEKILDEQVEQPDSPRLHASALFAISLEIACSVLMISVHLHWRLMQERQLRERRRQGVGGCSGRSLRGGAPA